MNLKSVAKWTTGIMLGVVVVAAADDYVHVRDSAWDKETRKSLDIAAHAVQQWNYTD